MPVHGYAADAGRDPAEFGIACGMRVSSGDDPQLWVETALAYDDPDLA